MQQDVAVIPRAASAGLVFRSPLETATDALAWAQENDEAALTDGGFARLEPELARLIASRE